MDREGRPDPDIEKLVTSLVGTTTLFFDNESSVFEMDLGNAALRDWLTVEFDWYTRFRGDDRAQHVRALCVWGVAGTLSLYMRDDEYWMPQMQHYKIHFGAPKMRQLYEMRRARPHGAVDSDPPRFRKSEVRSAILRAASDSLPERHAGDQRSHSVSIGMRGSVLCYDAYLFTESSDPRDVLFIGADTVDNWLTGGFGLSTHGFYTGMGFPCWGEYVRWFSEFRSLDELEQQVHALCAFLKRVHPYHKMLWRSYFDLDDI